VGRLEADAATVSGRYTYIRRLLGLVPKLVISCREAAGAAGANMSHEPTSITTANAPPRIFTNTVIGFFSS
jgi:hypothetical protein